MAEILQVKYFNLDTGEEIPMSQQEEDKEKGKWKKKLGWILGYIIVGIFYGIGTGGSGFAVKKIEITAVDRPGTNK